MALDVNKPLYTKVYEFDKWAVGPDGTDDKGPYAIQEIDQIQYTVNHRFRESPVVLLRNGSQTCTFEILPTAIK